MYQGLTPLGRSAETYAYDQSKDDRMKRWLEQKDLIVEAFAGRPGCCEEIERLKVDGKTYNELLCDADYTKTGGEVHEVYLNMKKPLIVDAECRDYYKVYPEYFKEAKARGCDGVIVRSVNDTATGTPKITNVYIVFKPEQIKSVDNLYPTPSKEFRDNSLEYLKITKDMTFAERKEVSLHAAQILREAAKKNLHRAINEQDRGHISLYSSLVCAFIMLKLFLFY